MPTVSMFEAYPEFGPQGSSQPEPSFIGGAGKHCRMSRSFSEAWEAGTVAQVGLPDPGLLAPALCSASQPLQCQVLWERRREEWSLDEF